MDGDQSSSSRNQHRRLLERASSPRPSELLGAGSSISGSQSFSPSDKGESCPVWPGQLHCSSVHQPAGRYKISTLHSTGTIDIWCCTLDRNMVISAIHVPGKWNRIADGKSRIFHDSIEWMLDHNLFKQITKYWDSQLWICLPLIRCQSLCHGGQNQGQ